MARCYITKNNFVKYGWSFLVFIISFVVVVDQVTKHLVVTNIPLYKSICVIPGFLNITFITNVGTAFGFFSSLSPWYRNSILFLSYIFSFFVLLYFYICLRGLHRKTFLGILAVGMIAGGAIGNIIDRVIYGHVVDFIDVYVGRYHWPAFNVADSCITIGIFFTVYILFFQSR